MNMKITLSVLFEALIILGHDRVWMEESEFEHIYGYGCYREIHTWWIGPYISIHFLSLNP